MSRTRRNFSAKFKSDLVLEVLKGEKELNIIATENGIQPNPEFGSRLPVHQPRLQRFSEG